MIPAVYRRARSLASRLKRSQPREIASTSRPVEPASLGPVEPEADVEPEVNVEDLGPFTQVADANLTVVFGAPIVEQIAVYPSEIVELPALPFSAKDLDGFDIRENVSIQPWSETSYRSLSPHVRVIHDAIVHGSVGIVAFGQHVVHETLWHTDPLRHRFRREGDDVVLFTSGIERLEGTTVSVLVGAAESYWHSIIDATARLILIPELVWQSETRVLLPSSGVKQLELFHLFGLPEAAKPRVVEANETFRVEQLIHPSSLHGLFDYHPTLLNRCFDRLLANTPPPLSALPRRIVIDRRGSSLRKLVNEQEVQDSLPDFTPIALEDLTIVEQIQLFAQVDMVVAPHGAGLTNIGFARPGTVVVELMMDAYCNWCYRRLAALRKLNYICVLGRSIDPWKEGDNIHLKSWTVEIDDVKDVAIKAEAFISKR